MNVSPPMGHESDRGHFGRLMMAPPSRPRGPTESRRLFGFATAGTDGPAPETKNRNSPDWRC